MADIISIDKKRTEIQTKQSDALRRRKLMAVRKVFQCAHCALKCEKCGTPISEMDESDTEATVDLRVPYRFCESCALEYLDYIERLKGGDSDCYWHNDAWLQSWRSWIDYQSAVDRYLNSKEFHKLIEELKQTGLDR